LRGKGCHIELVQSFQSQFLKIPRRACMGRQRVGLSAGIQTARANDKDRSFQARGMSIENFHKVCAPGMDVYR
jgi:hypothetical protein